MDWAIWAAARPGSWCSQTLITVQPESMRSASYRRSLSMFRASFAFQYLLLRRGLVPCSGHPCQKQPSTNTASLARGKTMSGRIGRLCAKGRIGWSTRKRRPEAKRADRSRFSGRVSRRRLPCIVARTAGLEALGGVGSRSMVTSLAGATNGATCPTDSSRSPRSSISRKPL
jgi:hypothetical protein